MSTQALSSQASNMFQDDEARLVLGYIQDEGYSSRARYTCICLMTIQAESNAIFICLTSQSTVFQSSLDGANISWVLTSTVES